MPRQISIITHGGTVKEHWEESYKHNYIVDYESCTVRELNQFGSITLLYKMMEGEKLIVTCN